MTRLFLSATLLGLTGLPLAGSAQIQTPPAPPASNAWTDPRAGRAPAPVAPAPQTLTIRSGRVRSVMAGPDGTVQSFVLRDGSTITIPPASSQALRVHEGTLVHVTGQSSPNAGANQITAQSIRVGRQTFVFVAAAPVGLTRIAGGGAFLPPPAGGAPPPPLPPPSGGPVPPPPPPPPMAGGSAPPPPAPPARGITPPPPVSGVLNPPTPPNGAAPPIAPASAPAQEQAVTPTPQP